MKETFSPPWTEDECPGISVLKNFEMGYLEDSDSLIVAAHLAGCKRCEASIRTINLEGETLVSLLRSTASVTDSQDDSQVERLESFGKQLILSGETQVDFYSGSSPGSGLSSENREGTTLGEYLLCEMIGQGGMGTVYKAIHRRLNRTVALKIITADCASPSAIARFRREMKVIGKLDDHPYLVKATDAGEENGTHFLAMEYIQGENLSRFVKRNGRLEIADACEMIRQTALGASYVHNKGLVHRDIKPANLMLTEQGTIKLLDLGLARLHEEALSESDETDLTRSDQILGTVDYMSPEQIDQSYELDHRSDIYSLGCTLYFLLAGVAPFSDKKDHASSFQKMRAHIEQQPPEIQTHREEIPDELAKVVDRCLSKNPAERFQTADELIDALESFCENQQLDMLSRLTDQTIDLKRDNVSNSSPSTKRRQRISEPKKSPLKHRPFLLVTILAISAGILALFGGVIVLYTGSGTLEITVNEPDVKVSIDGKNQEQINIETKDQKVTIKLDVKSGRHKMSVTKNGFKTETREFRIMRGGKTVVSATLKPKRNSTNRWHLPTKLASLELKRYLDHNGEVRAVDLSPDGKQFVSGGEDGKIRLWDVETGKLVKTIKAHRGSIWDLSFSPDGSSVLSGGMDNRVRRWNLKNGRMIVEWNRHSDIVSAVDFSPDGKSFVTGGWTGRLFLYESKNPIVVNPVGYSDPENRYKQMKDEKFKNLEGHIRSVRVARFDRQGEKFLSAGNDNVIFIWDSKGEHLLTRLVGHKLMVTDAVFSPDGHKVLSGSYDFSCKLWDIDSGQQLLNMVGHTAPVHAVAISPDGKYGLTGGGDATIQLWDLVNGKRLHTYDLFYGGESENKKEQLTGTETNSILCLTFLPDGKRFLAACGDGSIRMWKLPEK